MATLSQLLPLLRTLYIFSKLCGFRNFYYHPPKQAFVLLTRRDNWVEWFYTHLMYIINVVGTPLYIALRFSIEYKNEYMNSIQPGVYAPPNFPQAITDSAYAFAYFLNCIFFKRNQQQLLVLSNELLFIHRALQKRKKQLKFSNTLLLLSYFLVIYITGTLVIKIRSAFKTALAKGWSLLRVTSLDDESSIWLLRLLLGCNYLLYELHLMLLLVLFVLLTGYCRQLSDLLLKTNNKTLKRSEKLMKLLPLLQSVQKRASRYFSIYLTWRMLELLHAVYCLVNTFKYDDASLHPLLEDFEEMELDQKLYHAPVVKRSVEVHGKTIEFLRQMLALLLELHALSVYKREQENLFDVITYPIDASSTRAILNAEQIYQQEARPDAILVCNDAESQRNLFDLMLDTEKQQITLSLDDSLGLHFYNYKVPLKMLKNSVNQICCSTFVLLLFDKLQQLDLKKLEQKYK